MVNTEKTTKTKESSEKENKFKGKFISSTGRRKTAVARVRLYKTGQGTMLINGLKADEYFTPDMLSVSYSPMKLAGEEKTMDVSVIVNGSGKKRQAEAVRHGISRALVELNKDLKAGLKAKGWMMRDARKKERKKPGLKRARRAPQWSKR